MKRSSIFWGVVVILVGGVLLLQTLGVLGSNAWGIFWAMLLIAVGLWFLLGFKRFGAKELETQQFSIPLDGAREVELELNHGAGRLGVHALGGSAMLLEGSFTGGVEQSVSRSGQYARVKLSAPTEVFIPSVRMHGLTWDIGLTREATLNIILHTGANETDLDLTELMVGSLRIETGASSTMVRLPSRAGFTKVEAKTGAASLEMRVPEGVAARIHTSSGLAGISIDTGRFPSTGKDSYESSDYASATNRVEISVETGVGSVDIR